MASPVVANINFSSVDTAGTSHAVNLPSFISAGNLLIVFFGWTSALPQTITWPAGWTPITNFKIENSTIVGGDAAYRQADGGELATITVTTDGSTKSAHTSYRITGHENPSTQAPEATTGNTGTAVVDTANGPNLTPTGGSKDYLWLTVSFQDGEGSITAAPTNYSNFLTDDTGIGGATSTNMAIGSAERALTAASEDPGVFTHSANAWAAQTVAIHPAGVGGATVDPFPYLGGGYYPVEG